VSWRISFAEQSTADFARASKSMYFARGDNHEVAYFWLDFVFELGPRVAVGVWLVARFFFVDERRARGRMCARRERNVCVRTTLR
jgi:hypothetical protein